MNAFVKKLAFCLTFTLGLAAAGVSAAVASETGSYGYLSVVEGSATLMQSDTDERSAAEVNQPVLAGDRLWVPERSRVEILLADRNILRIDGGSELVLERLAASPDGNDRATVVRLLEGNLQLIVTQDSLGDDLPRVETPNATIYPQDFGTYRVTADREGWSELVVRRGVAEVVTDDGKERVRADEEAVVDGDRYEDIEVREAGGFDSLERWARQLDDDYSSYASDRLTNVDDNLRYAARPLARYGDWVYVDGSPYWRPRVASGWRPYYQGRWVYTPAGLTWLSSEPWGWVPYHYGSWDYLPTYGWVWQPGYVWSPAWVYWYWGSSQVGWCPTGYYTRYYGSRFGVGFNFRYGVYGWAGGDWGHFGHWNFVNTSYFDYRDGYRDGRRDGYRQGYWDGRRDVSRYAVPTGGHNGPLGRGIITTDTRPLKPGTWKNPDEVLRTLRGSRAAEDLPDVTSFIARKPELPSNVLRTVRNDGNANLDGTPLKPSTLGRDRRAAGGAQPGDRDWNNGQPGKPRVVFGDGGGSSGGSQGAGPNSRGTQLPSKPEVRSGGSTGSGSTGTEGSSSNGRPRIVIEKPSRPAPDSDGGAPRPRRVEIDGKPSVRPGDSSSGSAPVVRERPSRPAPESDGGAPRPDRTRTSSSDDRPRVEERRVEDKPRIDREPVDREQIRRQIEVDRQQQQDRERERQQPSRDRDYGNQRETSREPVVREPVVRERYEPRETPYVRPEPSRREEPRVEPRQEPSRREEPRVERRVEPERSRSNDNGNDRGRSNDRNDRGNDRGSDRGNNNRGNDRPQVRERRPPV